MPAVGTGLPARRRRRASAIRHPATRDPPFTDHLSTLGASVCRDLVTAGAGAWQVGRLAAGRMEAKDELEECW